MLNGVRRSGRAAGARGGFTLIEAIVIIVILGVLAAVIGGRLLGRIGESKQAVATSNANNLSNLMQQFLADHGSEVRVDDLTIDALYRAPDGVGAESYNGPYVQNPEALEDPWGNKFVLRAPGEKNVDFDIISYGRDGEPGGEGEDADIVEP